MQTIFICHNYLDESFASMSFHLANHLVSNAKRVVFISKSPYYETEVKPISGAGELILTSWPSRKFSTSLKDFLWFAKLYRRYKPSHVIGHHNGSITSIITSKILGRKSVTTLEYYHVCTPSFVSDARGLTLRLRFFFFRKRLFYHLFCDHIICPSRFALKDLRDHFGYKKGLEIVNPLPDRMEEKKSNNSKSIQISFLGRLDPTKNVIQLLEAFKSHLVFFPDSTVTLQIAGTGQLTKEVSELVSTIPSASYLGKLPYSEVDRYISQSDFMIIPSFFDNLPTVSLESLMLGTPLLLSTAVGTRDYLDKADCLQFEPTFEGMTQIFNQVSTLSLNERKILSERSRSAYLRTFTLEKYFLYLDSIIQK